MKFSTGKLFQDINTQKVVPLMYQSAQNYYSLIQRAQEEGLRQTIVTSDIMIGIAENLLTEYSYTLTSIEFLMDDEELQEEIAPIIDSMKLNPMKWIRLKEKLILFSKDDSIDIRKINFKSEQGLFFVQVNGMFSAPATEYEMFSKKLIEIVEDYV